MSIETADVGTMEEVFSIAPEGSENSFIPGSFKELAVSPDKALIRMEALNLRDGSEIDARVWEPLFGGELTKLWDGVLKDPGDEVILKGSSVTRMVFGGYIYNTETQSAASSLRSDIDALILTPKVETQLENFAVNAERTAVSSKIHIGDLEVGFVSQERIRDINLAAANELHAWASKLPPAQRAYFEQGLVPLIQMIPEAGTEDLLSFDNFLLYEGIGVSLKRNEGGNITATLVDSMHYLEDPMLRGQLEAQKAKGEYFGLVMEKPNYASLRTLYMEAFLIMQDAEFANKLPAWTIDAIPRMIKGASELDIEMYGDGTRQSFFFDIYHVADRLAKGEKIFHLTPEQSLVMGDERTNDVNEWFGYKVQESFARASVSNTEMAFNNVFAFLPLGSCISPELSDLFKDYHETFPPNTLMMYMLHGLKPKDLPTEVGGVKIPDLPSIRTLMRHWELSAKVYGLKKVDMLSASQDESMTPLKFSDVERRPENMTEIMALALAAVGWDPERDGDKIHSVVENWKPKGSLKLSWKMEDMDFDMALEEEELRKKIQEFRKLLDE